MANEPLADNDTTGNDTTDNGIISLSMYSTKTPIQRFTEASNTRPSPLRSVARLTGSLLAVSLSWTVTTALQLAERPIAAVLVATNRFAYKPPGAEDH